MRDLHYRILNVFTNGGDRLSGNPLCVFEDGHGLDGAQMQALARQLNLSETTFVLPASSADATAQVRIFTPSFEMPFAGHPTLGTAHVVRALKSPGDRVVLAMKAGLVEVLAEGDTWTLRTAGGLETREPEASKVELAATLGLEPDALEEGALWVDTGAEQLVVPLKTADDVRRARPTAELVLRHGFSQKRGASMVYVWAPEAGTPGSAGGADDGLVVRFFFVANGSVVEDPATGSACANLGGWHLARRGPGAFTRALSQGDQIGRPSRLRLRVDEGGRIFVGGEVIELGRGTFRL